MKHHLLLILGMLFIAAPLWSAEPPYIDVRIQTDRSALWVGDRFHEVVTVVHDPQVRFVTDNLQEGTVNLEPFQILELQYGEEAAAGGRQQLRIDLLLTTYEAAAGELAIPSFNLFYFVDSAGAVNRDQTAETLIVPATTVLLQSTVPENVSSIRDGLSPPSLPLRYRMTFPLALGMLLLAIASFAPLFIHGKRFRASHEIARRRRAALEQLRNGTVDLVSRPVDSEVRMAEFYEETSRCLREYISVVSAVPSAGKSPRELLSILREGNGETLGSLNERVREIVAILEACERVRYAPQEFLVGTQLHSELTERLRALAASVTGS